MYGHDDNYVLSLRLFGNKKTAHDFCEEDSALTRSKNRRRKCHKEKFMTFPIK